MSDSRSLRMLSLLPVLGHPRDSKRISMLQSEGFEVRAAAFERDYHTGRLPTCPIERLGRISHGRYLSRLGRMMCALPRLRRLIRRSDACYASGPDMALMGLIAGLGLGKPMVLEVGDLRRIQVSPGMSGKVMRLVDRWIINRCALLVSTASGFAHGYYRDRLHSRTPVLLIENKLDHAASRALRELPPAPPPRAGGAKIRIGWFGVLRCPWSLDVLRHLVQRHGERFEVIIAGHVLDPANLAEVAANTPGMSYVGEYRSPDDLPSLYGSVDMVWTVYPGPEVTDPAWRWALLVSRSNRFYESCFFGRPIITMADSGDGEEVARREIGLCLDSQDLDSIASTLSRIDTAQLQSWFEALRRLPESAHSATFESLELARTIRQAVLEAEVD
ncbi:MAG: glycosyltransferase family 4 protein [Planctomycetes bacterium]|nr:glycosyltransferase family 4 protein [Planctomycetota bacterium]